MLKNYVTVALRTLKRNAGYSSINIIGLAAGLACCILIYLFVNLELSYDHFHSKHDRIYRVAIDITQSGQTRALAWSSPPLAEALVTDFPSVEQAVRIHQQSGTVRQGDRQFVENIYFADSTFFRVFDFALQRGDPQTALLGPGRVVMTKEQANRFFGSEDPLHKTITTADGTVLEVTGILSEIPVNSHFHPEIVASFSTLPGERFQQWGGMNLWTYIVLDKQADAEAVEARFPDFIKNELGETWAGLMTLHLQPLTSIYFESDRLPEIGPTGNRNTVYIFSAIGLIVLLIACINFVNLATAQSIRRSREVGIRKVLGVHRGQLIRQFLGESVLLTLLAMVMALAVAQLLLPAFGNITGYELSNDELFRVDLLFSLLGAAIFAGVVSGSYPAFVLSHFNPSEVLSGKLNWRRTGQNRKPSKSLFRRGLVFVQFVITTVLLIGTAVVGEQLDVLARVLQLVPPALLPGAELPRAVRPAAVGSEFQEVT
ncbi:MAG: ABC transporter permease, partial [Balneolaceae bacterium]|nr:ABC transporter permease [Balneolaceae bacterium]